MPRIFRVLFLLPFLFLPAIAQADPVVPALTIIGGTVTGGRPFGAGGIVFNLIAVDPATGQVFNVQGGGEGPFSATPALAVAGQTVIVSSTISGNLDLGFGVVGAHVGGESPTIPNVIQPTLDLLGTAGFSIHGTFFGNIDGPPLFTIDGGFSGPAIFHFIWLQPGDPRFEFKTVTITFPEAVPEPASLILLLTSVAGLGLLRRREKH
jgi:hypothetical protein